MWKSWLFPLLGALALVAVARAGLAVMSGDGWGGSATASGEHGRARAAIEREDWPAAIVILEKLVSERPFDDDAHTLLAFANRKRGRMDVALDHYHRALELNPYHRGALEYLAEARIERGELDAAHALLARIVTVCSRAELPACPEADELRAKLGARRHDAR